MEILANTNDQVLVIDDDAILRELLTLLLKAEGHAVRTAESGDAALALLATLSPEDLPAVLLTDLRMPGVSHRSLAIRLRLCSPPPAVLVAMSASDPPADEVSAFDSFLRKPFTVSDYNAAVERARSAGAQIEGMQASAVLAAPAAVDEVQDRQNTATRVLNETVYSKLCSIMGEAELPPLYNMFMDDADARLHRMSSAVAVNDAVTFSREAHAIKGGCGMLGARELYTLASRMETGGLACSSLVNDFRPALERLRRILEERMN